MIKTFSLNFLDRLGIWPAQSISQSDSTIEDTEDKITKVEITRREGCLPTDNNISITSKTYIFEVQDQLKEIEEEEDNDESMVSYTEETSFKPIFLHSILPEITHSLQNTYAVVESCIEPCPDLTEAPFNLKVKSLGRQIVYLKTNDFNSVSDHATLSPSSKVLHMMKNGIILTDGEVTHALKLLLKNGTSWKTGIRNAMKKCHLDGNWGLLALQILSSGNIKFSIITNTPPPNEINVTNVETKIWLVPIKKVFIDQKSFNSDETDKSNSVIKKKVVKKVVKKKVPEKKDSLTSDDKREKTPEVVSEIKEDVSSVAYVIRLGQSPAKDGISLKDEEIENNVKQEDVGRSRISEKIINGVDSLNNSSIRTGILQDRKKIESLVNDIKKDKKKETSPDNKAIDSNDIEFIEQPPIEDVPIKKRSSLEKSFSPPSEILNDISIDSSKDDYTNKSSPSSENTTSGISSALLSERSTISTKTTNLSFDDLKKKLDTLSSSLIKERETPPPKEISPQGSNVKSNILSKMKYDKEETPTLTSPLLFTSTKSSLDMDNNLSSSDNSKDLTTRTNILLNTSYKTSSSTLASDLSLDRTLTPSSSSIMSTINTYPTTTSGYSSLETHSKFLSSKENPLSASYTAISPASREIIRRSASRSTCMSGTDNHNILNSCSNVLRKIDINNGFNNNFSIKKDTLGTVKEDCVGIEERVRGMQSVNVAALQLVLKTLSYEELGKKRQVHPHWDELCGQLLNSGYYKLIDEADKLLSECQRNIHINEHLVNPIKILTNLQLFVLNPVDILRAPMDEGILCFPYGLILDKAFILINKVKKMISQNIDPETPVNWEELANLAKKAQIHYKKVVESEVEKRMGEVNKLTAQQRLQRIDSFLIETTVEQLQKKTSQNKDELHWEMEQLKHQNASLKKDNREMKAQLMRFEGRIENLERKFKTIARLLQ
uniref:Death domain-containing protein n=1 Tax=Strongyloides venezuelensis TaxID=75913 RepID=A0A0K0F6J7_STRVS